MLTHLQYYHWPTFIVEFHEWNFKTSECDFHDTLRHFLSKRLRFHTQRSCRTWIKIREPAERRWSHQGCGFLIVQNLIFCHCCNYTSFYFLDVYVCVCVCVVRVQEELGGLTLIVWFDSTPTRTKTIPTQDTASSTSFTSTRAVTRTTLFSTLWVTGELRNCSTTSSTCQALW